VVPEKDAPTYRTVISDFGLVPDRCWMIGNSPRSDINPALAVGMNAVFIPHAETWRLEHQDIDPVPDGQRLIEVARFSDLLDHFGSGSH
jgi:putative hydrolase of the HAD superfamily